MAIKKEIEIIVDTEKANDNLETLGNNVDKIGDNAKNSAKGFGGMTNAVKNLGVAFKALGIGLIVAAIAALTEAFSRNQKVANTFSAVMTTIGIVLNQVSDVLVSVYENVAKNAENFNGLKAVLLGAINLVFTPLKLTFYAIKLAIQEAQLVWEKSFFGDKDQRKIKELNKDITETQNAIKGVAKDAVQSGKDIVNNFGDAISEVGAIGSQVVDGLSKISIKAAYETAKANVALKNAALLAAAQQSRLVEQYDRAAEKQRQIRDSENKSIAERTKANEELGRVLEKQQAAMIKQANLQVAAAQNELKVNKTVENQVALIEALANKEGVLAQIEGLRSEQLVNSIALKKEAIELDNSIADAEKERQIAQLDFEANQQKTELEKLGKLKEKFELEAEIIEEDIIRKRELYAEGTQARVDAENEYALKKQEINNSILENDKLTAQEQINIEKQVAEARKGIQDAQISNVVAGFGLIASLNEKNKALQAASLIAEHGSGIAKTIINTRAANAAVTLKYATIPGGVALAQAEKLANNISAGLGIAASTVALGKGLAAIGKGGGGGSGGGVGNEGSAPQAPSFNLVQGTGSNQIAESIGKQQPLKAYVVAKDVTTGQSMDRNIIADASL